MINNTVHTTSQPVEYMSKKKHILSIFITQDYNYNVQS